MTSYEHLLQDQVKELRQEKADLFRTLAWVLVSVKEPVFVPNVLLQECHDPEITVNDDYARNGRLFSAEWKTLEGRN